MQLQITSNAQKAEEEKKLKDLEAEWLKEETRLRKEEEEWARKEKLRRQEHAKRVRDASVKLREKKQAKERNEELALEHQLLQKLLEDTRNQEKADVQRKSDLREENLKFMAYVAKNRKDEQEREKKLEEMIHEEMEVKWQKDLAKYRLEREARKKLLENVLDTRRQQIEEKSKLLVVNLGMIMVNLEITVPNLVMTHDSDVVSEITQNETSSENEICLLDVVSSEITMVQK